MPSDNHPPTEEVMFAIVGSLHHKVIEQSFKFSQCKIKTEYHIITCTMYEEGTAVILCCTHHNETEWTAVHTTATKAHIVKAVETAINALTDLLL